MAIFIDLHKRKPFFTHMQTEESGVPGGNLYVSMLITRDDLTQVHISNLSFCISSPQSEVSKVRRTKLRHSS